MNRLFGNQGEVAPREEPKETQNGKTEKAQGEETQVPRHLLSEPHGPCPRR